MPEAAPATSATFSLTLPGATVEFIRQTENLTANVEDLLSANIFQFRGNAKQIPFRRITHVHADRGRQA
jgi:hypothetical protein